MLKIIKNKSTFSFIEERDWYIGDLKLREAVIEEKTETHYNNGFVSKNKDVYYIRHDNNGVRSGEVCSCNVIRQISIQRCIDVMNAVDWNKC